MKLLFLTNFFPPNDIGGYEQLCDEVAGLLRDRGHDVFILTSRLYKKSLPRTDSKKIFRVLYLESDINYYQPLDFFLKRKIRDKTNIGYLRKAIKEISPEIIMVWGMWNLSLRLPFWAEKVLPGRVIYYIASYWPTDENPHAAYWKLPTNRPYLAGIKNILKSYSLSRLKDEDYPPTIKFDHAYCCSEFVKNRLTEAGKLQKSASVIYNGIDPKLFLEQSKNKCNHKDSSLRLLYFGRLIHDKGIHTAIEALGILKRRGLAQNIILTVLGSGHPDYEKKLLHLTAKLDVVDHIVFSKPVRRDEIPQIIGEFDIYLFTSIWPEPMARTVMEAMAAGLLVIGTEVGGQKEMLINGENALTFPPENPECLAEQIMIAKNDPELRQRLAQAGQQTIIQKFTLDRMVNEIESKLNIILAEVPETNRK